MLTRDEAISKVVTQFTRYNPTLINCVNKGAIQIDSFKDDVYLWMKDKIPPEYMDTAYDELCASAWNYDILKPLIYDDGAI